MAPTLLPRTNSDHILHQIARSIPSSLHSLHDRDVGPSNVPAASVFAVLNPSTSSSSTSTLTSRALSSTSWIPGFLRTSSLRNSIFKRQQMHAIPATYAGLNAGPAPGAVVGIVLGAVAGFLLGLWLLYTCLSFGVAGTLFNRTETVVEEEVIRRRSRSPRRRRSRSEVIEVVRSRSPPRPRRESRRETIVVEETIRREEPEGEDDIVEVIEEHSPPRRPKSKRTSGFRTVDPAEFGGGGRPMRKVRR